MRRFFDSGKRNIGKNASISTRIIRETIQRGGKIDEEVFRKIVRAKLSEKMAGSGGYNNQNFQIMGKPKGVTRSKKAQMAIDQMNAIAKAKMAKKDRPEIIIVPRYFTNGRLDNKGRIWDLAGNPIGQVNKKNGAISSIYGETCGVYKPKSTITNSIITAMIDRNSPYIIAQRRNILLQRQLEEEEARARRAPSAQVHDVWGHKGTHGTLGDIWGNRTTDIWGNFL